jgi:hypothetical protein
MGDDREKLNRQGAESAKPDFDYEIRSGLGGLWRLGGSTSRE